MARLTLLVNGARRTVDVAPETPLLWVLRDALGLTGTKYGCGIAQCGACTVLLDGEAVRSCQTQVKDAAGHRVTTIEGLSKDGGHPVQRAWVADEVPQCGYCQSGQIMQAAALLATNPSPSREEIVQHMNGNLCRCATYSRNVGSVHRAAVLMKEGSNHG